VCCVVSRELFALGRSLVSQQPATCPSAEQEKSNPDPLIHFFKKHFNITLKLTSIYSKGFFPSSSSPQAFKHFSSPHTCHMPLLSTSSSCWFYSLIATLKVPNCASPLHSFRCLGFPVFSSTSSLYALILSVSSILIPPALHLLGVS